MRGRRINLFATKEDLLLVLRAIETRVRIKYTCAGMLGGNIPQIWNSAEDLPRLGQAAADQESGCDTFLVLAEEATISVESQRMLSGRLRFDVDQLRNPDSVILRVGGYWTDGTLISGNITSISAAPISEQLMKMARSSVKKYFTHIRAYWVGPEALASLRSGKRLAVAVQSPRLYDLREE